ncbi:hypothetical protein [Pseudoalteromonas rubra]|uniref:hypothetical protein n=1 Tax=Pseudoalteromonas rubra TaxID=43658 RepID=UPI001BB23187|nr:hypothetical protein [Pseudoalteromonas rubra]
MVINKQSKGIFSYPLFWCAILFPVVISTTLMLFIGFNDNLTFQPPSRESLALFLDYMKVPLWILGSAIPFATLAAANYRAIQFQDNLDFQRRNTERQELEHTVELYHKELSLFKEKFEAIIYNGKFNLIRSEDSTIIYTRFYPKPKRREDVLFQIDEMRVKLVYEFMKLIERVVFDLGKINSVSTSGAERALKADVIKQVFNTLSGQEQEDIIRSLNIYDVKLINFLLIVDEKKSFVCSSIGIKNYSVKDEPVVVVIRSILDIIGLHHSILPEEDKYNQYRFSDKRRAELCEVLDHWLEYSSTLRSDRSKDNYSINDFINSIKMILAKSSMQKTPREVSICD